MFTTGTKYLIGSTVVAARPSQECPEPRKELGESERLGEVVVRARVEPGDAAVHLRTRGQHQHGYGIAGAAEPATYLEPVDTGHEDVEDQRIGALRSLGDHRERRFTIGGELDVIPLELERALKRLADRPLVVHDKDAHLSALCARGRPETAVLPTS